MISRLVGATLICLLIVAIMVPSLGHFNVSKNTVEHGWPESC
jgi:hypothetical protein